MFGWVVLIWGVWSFIEWVLSGLDWHEDVKKQMREKGRVETKPIWKYFDWHEDVKKEREMKGQKV